MRGKHMGRLGRATAPIRRAVLGGAAALLAVGCAPLTAPDQGPRVDPTAPIQIALLVPTDSGDAARDALGQSLANAAQLAAEDAAGAKLQLAIYPTGGEAARATDAATAAVAGGAQLIVGPLFSTATAAAAAPAAGAGVPILSFSNTATVGGENVYLLGLGQRTVAERMVGYLTGQGLRRIAAVTPEGLEGDLATEALTAATAAAGATLTGTLRYPLSVDGITETAQGIANALRESETEAAVFSDTPTGGLVFMAESLRGLGIRADRTRFAGLARWSASEAALGQPALEGGWFAAPDPRLTEAFAARYEARFGAPPHPLAGLAFDGVAAAAALVEEARSAGARDPFSQARLTDPQGFAGVLGAFRFRPDGQSDRALAIFRVENGAAVLVDPAAQAFDDSGV